jgi:hypothetical protein
MLAIVLDVKDLELLGSHPWAMPEIRKTPLVFPQHEEITWNKLHRYFCNQLDGI